MASPELAKQGEKLSRPYTKACMKLPSQSPLFTMVTSMSCEQAVVILNFKIRDLHLQVVHPLYVRLF